MMPTLYDGDLVFFKKYSKEKTILKIGDIVIFHHPYKNIRLIKRVKAIKEYSIEVTGDNKNSSNDSKLFGFIQKEKIIGIVTSKISNKSINNFKKLFNL
tara:strand:- start:5050 stop:5346 length:297 start_codon:yes stop_codon:yes gene_type:complete